MLVSRRKPGIGETSMGSLMPMLGFFRFILRLFITPELVEKLILKIKYLGWFVTTIANPRPEQPNSTYG
jgi:hypothetical protein